jgi:hypothetical protein
MTNRKYVIGLGVAAALAAGLAAYSVTASAQEGYGPGMMGGGYGAGMMGGNGPGGGYGPGMMGGNGPGGGNGGGPGYHVRGYGPGMMGGNGPGYGRMGGGPGAWICPAFAQGNGPNGNAQGNQDLNLTTDQVKTRMERWLAWRGNPHVKLGDVKEQDANTITADVVTKDNSLVEHFVVDRHNGFVRRDNS